MGEQFNIGDVVEMTGTPRGYTLEVPVGDIGFIVQLYAAAGGPAAVVQWDKHGKHAVLLRDLSLVQEDIFESAEELDLLLS